MKMRFALLIALLLSVNCFIKSGIKVQQKVEEKRYSDITAKELMQELEQGKKFILIDVRTSDEYAKGYIEGAILIPYTEIEDRYKEISERFT